MVQWFKSLFRKKPAVRPTMQLLLDTDVNVLRGRIERAAEELYACRMEDSSKILRAVIEHERTLQVLRLNGMSNITPLDIARQQGRLDSLNALSNWIGDALSKERHDMSAHKEKAKVVKLQRARQQWNDPAL